MKVQFDQEDFTNLNTTITIQEEKALNEVAKKCFYQSGKQGWHKNPREVGTMLALIHSEISEALEGVRKGKKDDHLPHKDAVDVELADAVIRIFDLAAALGYNLGSTLVEKYNYNAQRADHKLENRVKEGGKAF
jgi:NTP pyrophosphatase (non-canonical NTP hydrolase)